MSKSQFAQPLFDHEKLVAYQRRIQFVAWSSQRCRFEIARGSALECAACPDVLVAKANCTVDQMQSGWGRSRCPTERLRRSKSKSKSK